MKRLRHKHPLAIRWFHWLNFPLLFLMIWSGMLIYWANSIYRIGWGPHELLHLPPLLKQADGMPLSPDLFQRLGWDHLLSDGMAWHFAIAWLFVINGLLYVGYLTLSGQWRYLVPNRRTLKEAALVVLHDLRLRKDAPPIGKYNGAQQIAYTGVILMGAASLATGLAIYKPVQLYWLNAALGGYEWARWEHFWLTILFLLFFVVHVEEVIRAGWNNFRGMISGYSVEPSNKSDESVSNGASGAASTNV